MTRPVNRLSARAAATVTKPGRHADGGGLYLVVGPGASRRWVFLWKQAGRLREMGLGSVLNVTLARARELATSARQVVARGGDPIAERRDEKAAVRGVPTFGEVADEYVATKIVEFRNEKHRYQWRQTLETYAAPLRPKPVDQITTADVLAALKPVWTAKPETASRLRGRIERVLNAAAAAGHRSGPNPAAWRNHLENLLPRRQKLSRGHLAAMPYAEVPAFIEKLRGLDSTAAFALEYLVLTAARSNEVRGARWEEIDFDSAVWTVPAARMKAGRVHRVPLSERAVEILLAAAKVRISDHVFPGQRPGKPLSEMTLTMLMRRNQAATWTVHGFRSAFRDWAGNETSFPREIAEAALAHTIGDEVERAYRRSDALERRRVLMAAWAQFCDKPTKHKVSLTRTDAA